MNPSKPSPSLLVIICVISIVKCAFFLRGNDTGNIHFQEDHHTIPTILSVVDKVTGKYVYALNNPLYDRLNKGVAFEKYNQKEMMVPPKLHFSQNAIDLRAPLSLTWTLGRDRSGQTFVHDDDIILLYCDDQLHQTPVFTDQFLDAATIGQARASTVKHREGANNNNSSNNQEWYFLSFPVSRHDVCQFRLVKSLPRDRFALLAVSDLLYIRDGKSSPTAIHLALGDSVDEMVVQFKTGIKEGTPVVRYGTKKDVLNRTTMGSTHSYIAEDMCQEPANEEQPGKFQPPGQLHVVRLTHLSLDTTWYYQVGVEPHEEGETKWSQTSSFISAPEVQADAKPFSYLVYGDQGCPSDGWGLGGAWVSAMAEREANQPVPIRAVHHFGDLSYGRGAAHIWDEWLNMIASFAARVPLMISVGNHEYDHTKGGENGKDPSGETTPGGYQPKWGYFRRQIFGTDSGGECGVTTASHFTMPNGTYSNGVFWYSYDFGNVHTLVISSEHDMSPGSRQYKWLEEDLESVNRASTPWLVLELHRPMYESQIAPRDTLVGKEIRHRIEHLLRQYKVDLVLAGHYHTYQRTCGGLYKGECNNGGPTHLTIGSAGARPLPTPQRPGIHWMEKEIKYVWGYGRITVMNATALHFEFVKAGPANSSAAGKVLDEMWLFKDHHALGTALAQS